MLTSEIYHESAHQFDGGVQKDEGMLKYYIRNIYLVLGLCGGIFGVIRAYQFTFEMNFIYEDGLD